MIELCAVSYFVRLLLTCTHSYQLNVVQNVLLTRDQSAKIADVGMAKVWQCTTVE